jgi:hypothetical protein
VHQNREQWSKGGVACSGACSGKRRAEEEEDGGEARRGNGEE